VSWEVVAICIAAGFRFGGTEGVHAFFRKAADSHAGRTRVDPCMGVAVRIQSPEKPSCFESALSSRAVLLAAWGGSGLVWGP
jgi:hypothetical protein